MRTFISLLLAAAFTLCASGCVKPDESPWKPGEPISREELVIGVIHVDGATGGYSLAHDTGVKEMQAALGLRDEQIVRKLNVNDADIFATKAAMRECIDGGANLIIATSWGHMDVCAEMAEAYPNVIFANASGYKHNDSNLTNYFGRMYEARYLSGVVAGLKTQTGKIGFVAAMDKANSEVTGGVNAFALGVESVNPGAVIYVKVTYNWNDPSAERRAAGRLIDEGCDVIAQHCNNAAPQIEAERAGVWGVGYNSDMSADAPRAVLTSVVWKWGAYYTMLAQSVIDGSFTTQPYLGGLADGMVGITALNESLCTPETESAVGEAGEKILNGEIAVFGGELQTNDGRTVGSGGAALTAAEILNDIDWYYRNVVEMK